MIRLFKIFLSILWSYADSLVDAFAENEYTQQFKERYPRLFRFVRNRLSPNEYLGLHLTVGFFIVLYLTTKIIALVRAMSATSLLLDTDVRMMNLVVALRTGEFVKPMLFFTSLGNWPTVLFFFLASLTFLVWKKQWFHSWILFLAVAGGGALSFLLKIFIVRPRPDAAFALLTENTYGFPSGHALVGLAFYGCVAYFLFRSRLPLLKRATLVFLLVALIFFIGASRIYLGVHWPSDVLGGTIIGLIWLTILLTAVEIRHSIARERARAEEKFFSRWFIVPFVALWCFVAFVYIGFFTFQKRSIPSPIHPRDPASLTLTSSSFDRVILDQLPAMSEGLTGRPIEPVSLLLVSSEDELHRAFTGVGWALADPLRFDTIIKTARYIFFDAYYPEAPVTPAFVYDEPQTFAWQKSTDAKTARQRHHVRLWRHPTVQIQGKPLWLGTASFDASLKLSPTSKIPTHQIAPAIDRERDFVVADLEGANEIRKKEIIDRYEPFLGINFVGDPFFTDGKVIILYF